MRAGDGRIKSFDPPGSTGTYGQAVDSSRRVRDAVTGFYDDSSGFAHGFLRTRK